MHSCMLVLASLALSPSLAAQSLNVNACRNGAFLAPSPAYAGAAGQTGRWCAVVGEGNSQTNTLIDVHDNGLLPAASQTTGGLSDSFDHPGIDGDDALLLEDGTALVPPGAPMTWRFGVLEAGRYRVTTYAFDPETPANVTEIAVLGAFEGPQIVGGAWSGAHAAGVTYAQHTVDLAVNGGIEIRCTGFGTRGFVNGFQLAREEIGMAFCFGDGSAAPCPCANHSDPLFGRGCGSSNGGSMHLAVYGSTTPTDTIVLDSHPQHLAPHNGLRVFMQGTAAVSPAPFGDGLSCLGGTLKRLYAAVVFGGYALPGPGDPSVSAQSAALGDPIAPGSTRYYTIFYRDGAPGFCDPPLGSTFNVSNAYALDW